MTKLLTRLFVTKDENVQNNAVRGRYNMLVGVVNIVFNFILFGVKLTLGVLLNSVAVMADSVNNLSDCGSSIVSILGFKMASKPPDLQHPFGHGRMEYFAALVVSLFIMLLGVEFFQTSIGKIFTPTALEFSLLSIFILFLTVLIKVWLGFFSKKIGKQINSKSLIATGQDAHNDVIITSVTIVSVLVAHFTGLIIDGYAGVAVAILLLKSGFDIAKDAFSPLLGESISKEDAAEIKEKICAYEGILGVHDLIMHNYGPGRFMASVHAEIDVEMNPIDAHVIVDQIEKDFKANRGIDLVIHSDPVQLNDEHLQVLIEVVMETIKSTDERFRAHDFRIVTAKDMDNFIFDLVAPFGAKREIIAEVCKQIETNLFAFNPLYHPVIEVETSFTRD